jgi:nucleoside-diphosphate-sugar epimerase
MKIALIGAGEFAAVRMIESFHLGAGPSVAAIARHPAELTAAARFAIDLRVADFFNVDSLARSFAGCSAVVHAARHAPADLKRASTVLCRAAAQAGVRRVVFLSSADVHGPCPLPGTNEKSPLHTHHPEEIHNSLVLAERQFFTECRQLSLAGYALRAGCIFGPRSEVIGDLTTALETERAWLLRNGDGICNSVYVDNLVAAVRLALKAKSGAGSAFFITDAETITWRDFYHAAAQELHVSTSGIRNLTLEEIQANSAQYSAELIVRQQCNWKLPTARAAAELGYEAPVPFAEGMRRSFAWWRFAQGDFSAAA